MALRCDLPTRDAALFAGAGGSCRAGDPALFGPEVVVHTMTRRCTRACGPVERGAPRPGAHPAPVRFDPATVRDDGAPPDDSRRPATGIRPVWPDAVAPLRAGTGPTGARPGRPVTRHLA